MVFVTSFFLLVWGFQGSCIYILNFILELNNIPSMDIAHFVFMHSSVDGHFDCFYFLAIINSATMNIHVQVFM